MRRVIARLPAVLVLVAGASVVWAFSDGPPVARTGAIALGAYPAENTCAVSCHADFPLNDANGQLEILDVPDLFLPYHTYTLRVRLRYDLADPIGGDPRWGFELTALNAADGTGAGVLHTPDPGAAPDYPDSLKIATPSGGPYAGSGRQYIEHTHFALRTDQAGPVEWQFTWTAPGASVAKVYFFAAGNAADGSGNTSGDYIFTAVDSSDIGDINAAPIPRAAALELSAPRPNPAHDRVRLGIGLARAGVVDLSVFDASGRRVKTLLHGDRPAGRTEVTWDGTGERGEPVRAGTYFAHLEMRDAGPAVTRRITLTR